MNTRASAVIAGLAAYAVLVVAVCGLHRLAFGDSGGSYPTWYSAGELVLNGAKAVAPGLIVGWLCRVRGIGAGAMVGAAGGVGEILLLGALTGLTFSEYPNRIAVLTLLSAMVSACTNAVGSAAGIFLRTRSKPSNFSSSGRDISASGADARRST